MGYPLPGVTCALRDLDSNEIFWDSESEKPILPKEGELYIKSPSMFNRYLNKPKET